MKQTRTVLTIFILLFSFLNGFSIAFASGGDAGNTAPPPTNQKIDSTVQKQIIDSRCTREKLLRGVTEAGQPPSEYSKICCEEKNTETRIECMEVLYPTYSEGGLWGNRGFNYLGTDVVFSRESIPLIIRMILTVVFAGFVGYYLWIAFRGFYAYLTAASESQNYETAQKYFTNALIGLVIGGGGILFTYLIFYTLGFRGNPFDFDEILDKSFLIDCKPMNTAEWCGRYDISCGWTGGECSRVDPEIQAETRENLSEGFCRGIVSNPCE
jgi:hypothetical protein